MTTLSWFFYLAMVAERLDGLFGALLFAFGVVVTIRLVVILVSRGDEPKDHWSWSMSVFPWWCGTIVGTLVLLLVATQLVPNYKTIMTITAVELGNDVLQSAEFQTLLDTYIRKD